MVSARVRHADDLPALNMREDIIVSYFGSADAHQSVPAIAWAGERILPARTEGRVVLSDTQPWKGGWIVSRALLVSSSNLAWAVGPRVLSLAWMRPPCAPSDVVMQRELTQGKLSSSPLLNDLGPSDRRGGSLAKSCGSSGAGRYLAPLPSWCSAGLKEFLFPFPSSGSLQKVLRPCSVAGSGLGHSFRKSPPSHLSQFGIQGEAEVPARCRVLPGALGRLVCCFLMVSELFS